MAEEKANQREKSYKENIKNLTSKLKQAEARAEFADKSVQKLQKEVRTSKKDPLLRVGDHYQSKMDFHLSLWISRCRNSKRR